MNYLIGFDTETGGLDCKKADLLTAYFCILDEDLKLVEELDLKLKPNDGRFPICESQALAVNKINIKEHLENPNTITYSEGKAKVMAFIRKYLKKKGRYSNIKAFGYNILGFDIPWVQEYLIPKDDWLSTIHYKCIDVMQAVDFLKEATWFPPELGSLGTVVNYLGLPQRDAHNAREDTLMTVDVYRKILEIMKSKKDGGGQSQDLISLLEAE